MTIFNLLMLVLVLVFSTKSMADRGCAVSSADMLWDQCPLPSDEELASRWKPPAVSPPPTPPKYYDERLLVLQWPPSFCITPMSNCHQPDRFTVHGLWFNINSNYVCCTQSNTLISFQRGGWLWNDLVRYWPDLKCPEHPETFWGREYAKHGSCVIGFQYQVDYFKRALNIAKDVLEVMNVVMKMGVSSSGKTLIRGHLYQAKDFDHVTIDGRIFFPSLRCIKFKNTRYPRLREIVFCTYSNNTQRRCTKSVQDCNNWNAFIFL